MKTFATTLLLLLLNSILIAQPLTATQRHTLDSLATRYLADDTPGVALGVVRGGQVIYEFYAGLADLDTGRAIDPDTRFNAASNGKQFTALCILELIETSQLALADDIRTYLPELYPDVAAPITIQHLLTHTSGIRDVYDLWNLQGITWWEVELDNAIARELLAGQQTLNFAPGSDYSYSNANYILLTEIVATVTGQPFAAYAESLFQRLEMPNTVFLADHTQLPATVARPYFNFDEWITYDWLSDLHGDGALFTTLPDQLRYESLLQDPAAGNWSPTLLRRSQHPITGAFTDNYGYGLEFSSYRNRPYRFHHGSTGAWKATTLRFPEQELAIVVLNNSGKFGTDELAERVADVLLGVSQSAAAAPYPTGPDRLGGPPLTEQEILGTYQIGAGGFFRFVLRDGSLFLERSGRDPVGLERVTGNLFQEIADPKFKLYFDRDSTSRQQITAYYPTHDSFTLKRLDQNWNGFDYPGLNGRYGNEELGTELELTYQADRRYLLTWNGQEQSGELFTPELLLVNGGYRLGICRDDTGRVTELRLATDRSQGIRFGRE